MKTNLAADTHRRFFQQKTVPFWKNRGFLDCSGNKGENGDMWMIKFTIKANQIDMDVSLISKVDNIQKPCLNCPKSPAFSINLLVCEFYPHGQTWYQKFIGPYPTLKSEPTQSKPNIT